MGNSYYMNFDGYQPSTTIITCLAPSQAKLLLSLIQKQNFQEPDIETLLPDRWR